MKRLLLICIAFFVVSASHLRAQSENDIKNTLEYKLQKGVYNRAIKYNDAGIAVQALYNLCVLEPRNDSLLYALQYLYYNSQNYISSILVANDVLMLNSKNTGSQEMKALSLERIGAKDKAIEEYESLYLKNSSNLSYLYKTAFLQYDLKRYKEAMTNVDILLTKKQADTLELSFPKGEKEQQQVPMKASLYNLKGMLDTAMGNKEKAKKDYNMALEIVPDFYLAKQNLDSLSVQLK